MKRLISLLGISLQFLTDASLSAPPPNDNFANAQELISNVKVSGTLDEATREPGDPDLGGNYYNVWFKWTASASGVMRLSLTSSESTKRLVAMIGESALTGKYLALGTSSLQLYAVSGQTYSKIFSSVAGMMGCTQDSVQILKLLIATSAQAMMLLPVMTIKILQ